MTETRPTGEQLRFISGATGNHILDTYLEAAEKGGRTLADLLEDIFDSTTGLFRADIFEFRITSSREFQFRVGDFPDTTSGWLSVADNPYLFRARSAWATTTAYATTDIVTYNNSTYYCVTPHTSTSTFDATKWAVMSDGTALNTATSSAQTSATNAANSATAAASSQSAAATSATNAQTSATNAATSATTATNQATAAQTSATAAAASQSAAATSATNAASSASAASTSATNAASSASSASSSASSASTSATNSANSATAAANSATAASTSASNAASSASSASGSATAAAASETSATASAILANDWATKTSAPVAGGEYSAKYHAQQAVSSASAASTSATNAAASESAAASSASSAASSATAAAASYDSFDDRYLGAKSSDPAADNDGNALLTGAIYWNSTVGAFKVYTGTSWLTLAGTTELDDLDGVIITSAATGNVLRFNGTDWVNYPDSNYAAASHTHSIANVTGLQSALDAKLDDSQATAFGLSLLDDADAAAGRSTLGLGSIATQSSASVSITGGSITGITDITVADGGTGQSTHTANYVLKGNGTSPISASIIYDTGTNVGIGTASPAVKLAISATDAIQIPAGTTAQRPTGSSGYIRYNSDLGKFEGYTTAWGSIGGGATGGGSDEIFVENGQIVTTNYSITAGKNAMTAGPITINGGVTVTVPPGSTWSII